MSTALDRLRAMARERAVVSSAASVIGWDQETYLPDSGHAWRADQLAWLSERAHELGTSSAWGNALAEAESNGASPALLVAMRRDYDRATKLPGELVAREAQVSSMAKQAWQEAPEEIRFRGLCPASGDAAGYCAGKGGALGLQAEAYDALLDAYERDTTASGIATLFDALRPRLRDLAAAAVERSAAAPCEAAAGPLSDRGAAGLQREGGSITRLRFRGGADRHDGASFLHDAGPAGYPLATRYDENDFTSSLFGVMHEAGPRSLRAGSAGR